MNNNDYPLARRTRLPRRLDWYGCSAPGYSGPPALLLRWRDEWPDIHEVPLAGETVTWNGMGFIVETGVPEMMEGFWCVACERIGSGDTWGIPISELNRTAPGGGTDECGRFTVPEDGSYQVTLPSTPGTYAIVRV